MHPFLDGGIANAPIALSHRGHKLGHPENTMAAFAQAIELGANYIETDVQVTSDGIVVVFHDSFLDRLTGRTGPVTGIDWPTMRQLKVGGAEPVPRLEEVLREWPEVKFNIDPKCDAVVRPFLKVIEDCNAWDRVCAGSFSGRRLKFLRDAAGPKLCTSMGPLEVFRLRLASLGLPVGRFEANCVQVPVAHRGITVVDQAFVKAAHKRDLPVHVWTVNDPAEMDRLLTFGVDGIVSDETELALAACKRHASTRTKANAIR